MDDDDDDGYGDGDCNGSSFWCVSSGCGWRIKKKFPSFYYFNDYDCYCGS